MVEMATLKDREVRMEKSLTSENIVKSKEKEDSNNEINKRNKKDDIIYPRKLSDYFDDLNLNPYTSANPELSFIFRDREIHKKNMAKSKNQGLSVVDKTTHSRRIKTRPTILASSTIENLKKDCNYVTDFDDYSFVLKITEDQRIEKESLEEYKKKKREMFLLHYSVVVKKEELNKLDQQILEEEKKLEQAEQFLEEDALMFDEFLKDNDKSAGEAIKMAEFEKKLKLEKDTELRALNSQILMIKGEISKYEGQLKEYLIYENFLTTLTPQEWLEKKKMEKQAKKKDKNEEENTDSEDEELELYFKEPQQLLDIFGELEEQNLSLIQNSQETEEALEEMKLTYEQTKEKLDGESSALKDQIDQLRKSIEKDEEEASNLATTAQMYFEEGHRAEDEAVHNKLHKTVEEAYRNCIGELETSLTTLQMLTAIEYKLEELFQAIDIMPKNKVDAAMRVKEKERRLKQRELKLELQRQHQEERFKKAMERANAEPRRKFGRKLVMRSDPPFMRKRKQEDMRMESKEEDDYACLAFHV